ncbi:PREDICTED: bidirectional sugar transporter SWEET12-like [Ipomoea nil]|uniref:bidirectional sugar transporter SWEET12-like n=1 Tax=Ipomoea nil TaxID=35883 RepID=UPI000900D6AB|nr:PREDICTED: bidirectional sugar transporter SWEET12-like [Ipomoea nil]
MALSGHWVFAFGVLGNIISFIVFLSPLPTFYQIYKKKSAEGYQSIPYVVALFSSMLWIYYAFLKSNATLLITINSFGCLVETIYIGFYIYYANKKARVQTIKMLVLLVIVGFGAVALVSQFLFKSAPVRAQVVGWVCLVFSLCVFVAPLCIVKQVIRTKSVEHMPILLSVFLTVSAVMWFFYGLLLKDINIAVPNVLGFIFGILQMVLYAMYKGKKQEDDEKRLPQVVLPTVVALEEKQKLPKELTEEQIVDIVKLGSLICSDKINVAAAACCSIQDKLLHQGGGGGGGTATADHNINIPTKPLDDETNIQPAALQVV